MELQLDLQLPVCGRSDLMKDVFDRKEVKLL